MRGLKTDRTARVIIRGHAFVQNLRRGHYELGAEARHEQMRKRRRIRRADHHDLTEQNTVAIDRSTQSSNATVPYEHHVDWNTPYAPNDARLI